MIRILALTALIGAILSVACLGGAVALAAHDIRDNHWTLPERWNIHIEDFDDDEDWDLGPQSSASTTREMAWDGSDTLELDVSADITYRQAPGPGRLVITGPASAVEDVQLRDGRLSYDGRRYRRAHLVIVMTAPDVTGFDLNGRDRLTLQDFDQPRLDLDVAGSARVGGAGKAREVNLDISGSGEVDLAEFAVENATVDIAGSGRATIAPRDKADLDIAGSGTVVLMSRPADLHTDIAGSGQVIQAAPPAPSAPASEANKTPPTK
ncbi:MAG: DUF2807 domain-containing protein [Caulobacteraceae bacterium]